MHNNDDEFLRRIPPFLRRYQEPPPRKLPIRPRDLPAAKSQAKSRPAPIAALAAAAAAPAVPKVVEIAQPIAPQPGAAESPTAQRARIALAFENESLDPGTAQDTAGEDVAFQVTLPRGVVRQIRMLAAEQDTTQRAVVLRALRLAGLSVPDGCDIDRRGRAAKRQA